MPTSDPKVTLWQTSFGIEFQQASGIRASTQTHFHDELQILWLNKGQLRYRVRKQESFATPGNFVIFPLAQSHSAEPVRDTTLNFQGLFIPPEYLSQLLSELSTESGFEINFKNTIIADELLAGIAARLFEATSVLGQETFLISFLNAVLERYTAKTIRPGSPAGNEQKAVQLVREHIAANFDRQIGLDELCQLTNLNKSYLVRVFRKTYHIPPHAFQNQLQLTRAKKLLAQGVSIAEVSQLVGFTHQSHFHRHFRRIYGFTPGYYQKMVNIVQDT